MDLARRLSPTGTEILLERIPHLRSCALGFWIRQGSCHEGPEEEGLAHFIEHAVFKGTASWPDPESLAAATDRLGGHLDAFTGKEVACFYGKVLPEQLPALVEILGELVTTPRFDGEELARERQVILEEIGQSEDNPEDWASELFYQNFWAGTPLAHSILGGRKQVSGFGAAHAHAFFERNYRAPNLLISAAGDLEEGRLAELLAPVLERLPPGPAPPPPPPNRHRPFLLNLPRKGLQQASLVLGFPGPTHTSAERAATSLLAHVLGGGLSSRLFLELRERRGLCYQVSAYPTPYRDSGALQISAGCAPENARELVARTLAECRNLAERGVGEEELDRARLQACTSLVFGQESSSSRMFSLAHQAIHLGAVQSLEEQMAEIRAVTPEGLQQVARRILDPGALGCLALGTRKGADIKESDLAA
ncbi:MAG: insulinase family protein [Acidobacteria bacterium]|nr:insulinase family protein [Acidobacteriota bacterium]